jgi:hypothetical protein
MVLKLSRCTVDMLSLSAKRGIYFVMIPGDSEGKVLCGTKRDRPQKPNSFLLIIA